MKKSSLVETESAFYEAIGRALETWAMTEDALAALFGKCLNPRSPHIAEEAFWAVVSFEGRLKMTDAALRMRFSGNEVAEVAEIRARWLAIHDELKARNGLRNKIAHGALDVRNGRMYQVPYFFSRVTREAFEALDKNRSRSRPHPKPDLGPKERITLAQLIEHKEAFTILQIKVRRFGFQLEQIASFQERAKLGSEHYSPLPATTPTNPT